MIEKENILKMLRESVKSLEEKNSDALKAISNQTVHSSSIHQDPDNILVAVVIYSLSKILEKEDKLSRISGFNNFLQKVSRCINHSIKYLEKNDMKNYSKHMKRIRKEIEALPGGLRLRIQDVFEKARINKASHIYEHGVSLRKTADLLGVSLWDLSRYVGNRYVSDFKNNKTRGVKERVDYARSIFK